MAISATLVLTACGTSSVVAPSSAGPTRAATDPAMLEAALQDERHAEQVYRRVLADHGDVLPFYNVVAAEQSHGSSIEWLMRTRSLPVPAVVWTVENVPRFASLTTACAAAAEAEVANIALYDRYLALDLAPDIRSVFVANRRASAERHLPAFERCR